MRIAPFFAVLGIAALAGCEIQVVEPPTTGPGWGGRPPSGQIDVARAQRACVEQAQRQGLRVRGVGRTEIVTGRRGRVIGTQTVLNVARGGRTIPVLCTYTFDTRIAQLTSIRRG